MRTMESYEEVRNRLQSGFFAADGQIKLNCAFDTRMAGRVWFNDLLCRQVFAGAFTLSIHGKTGAYIITLTFSKQIYKSRMPKLLYTVTQVSHLQAALEYALQTDGICSDN